MHAPDDQPGDGSTKRRKVDSEAGAEWSLELCPGGGDETLQIGRLGLTGREARGENALDSYRLETLAVAERAQAGLDGGDEAAEDGAQWGAAVVVSAQHVAIAMGSRIHVLSADCRAPEAVICHSGAVLATALNCDSSFVAYGDATGTLFIVHIRTRQPVFSQSVRPPDSTGDGPQAAVCGLHFAVSDTAAGQPPREELVVVDSAGHAVRFSGIQLCLLSQAILDGNMALAARIRSEILVEPVALQAAKRAVHQGGVTGLAMFHARSHSLLFASGCGDGCLSCWRRAEPGGGSPTRLADIVTSESAGAGYSRIQLSLDGRYLVALSTHGWIDVYERSTLTRVFRYADAAFDDFGLLAPPDADSAAMLVVAISRPHCGGSDGSDGGSEDDDDDGMTGLARRKLVVLSLPAMEVVYSMATSAWSWLARDSRSAQDVADTILFVEGLVEDGVQRLFLRSLRETVPLDRLAHFLRAGRYEEAQAFAETHGIPPAVVRRKRLEELLGNPDHAALAALRDDASVARFVDETLEVLDHVDDDEFGVRVCTDLAVPSLRGTRRLLLHARALAAGDAQRLADVDDALQRLGTWSIISGAGPLQAPGPHFDRQGWAAFRSTDLAACVRSCIAQGDIQRASAVWRRHRDNLRVAADIASAVQGFPPNVDTGALAGWLRVEVLPALDSREQWQDIAAWIEQRARMLESQGQLHAALGLVELLDPGFWRAAHDTYDPYDTAPGDAGATIDPPLSVCGPLALTPQRFIDGSLRAAQWTAGLARFGGRPQPTTGSAATDASVAVDATDGGGDPAAQRCLFLHRQLLDLVHLRDKHAMALTLDEYDQLSYSTIAVELLHRVAAPELLHGVYFDHFVPYARRHKLDHPAILREYCVELMDSAGREAANHAGSDSGDGDDDAAMSLDVSVRATQGHHSWEPHVLQLLACLYEDAVGRRSTDSGPWLLAEAVDGETAPTLLLTTSRAALLKTLFDVALDVMRRSTIPWPPAIDAVIARTRTLLGHYADVDADIARSKLEIGEQYRLMCLKRMLLSHGLPDFRISNTRMAYPLLQWLVRKTDGADVLPDALQLVDAYHHLTRTSAYVLRLQALCEAGLADQAGALVAFIDETEHSSRAPAAQARGAQLVAKYVPLEVARRGVCWIREALDSMTFGGEASRAQFTQLVRTAIEVLHALKTLAARYETRARESGSDADRLQTECCLSRPELEKLQAFVSAETAVLGVVWQLLVDGGIMVSPGELEQQGAREQILAEILDQQWLRAYTARPDPGARKGKGSAASAARGLPHEVLGLPLLPANVRTLATMLRFGPSQLGLRIVTQCLSLGLYMMALDMCQQMADSLCPADRGRSPPSAQSAAEPGEQIAAAAATARAAAMCERSIGRFLSELAEGTGPPLPGESHGLLARRLVAVCQAASLKAAAQPQLAAFLDASARWELARSIFDQTADGDFAALTRATSSALPARASASIYNAERPASPGASGSAAGAMRPDSDAHMAVDHADPPHEPVSGWLGPLYANQYAERGLVLDTGPSMQLAYRLVSALRKLAASSPDSCADSDSAGSAEAATGDPSSAAGKARSAAGTGKATAPLPSDASDDATYLDSLDQEELRSETTQRCHKLVAVLARNRHWILAMQAIQLTVSQLARSSFVVQGDALTDVASESLASLRQRLSSGGVGEDELEALFGAGDAAAAGGISDLAAKSLVRSLQQPGMDPVFIFSCMLLVAPVKAYQHLSTAMSHSGLHPSRVISLANIGAACSLVWRQQALLDRCRAVAAAARWSAQLQMLHLRFDVALLSDPKPELLEPLVRPMLLRTNMDIATLLEFAEAFRLDETFVVLEYISLCCSVPHVDSYQARVLGIADEIANPKLLERTYIDVLENRISSYDYERLHFVVQRLQELRPQDTAAVRYAAVLDMLSSYDRKSAPTHAELRHEWTRTRAARDSVRQMSAEASSADGDGTAEPASYAGLLSEYPLASRRLPFHSLVGPSPWTTLLAELSVDTVDMLLPLAPALELSEDDFYMNLVDGILAQWRSGDAAGDGDGNGASAAHELAVSKVPTRFNSIQQLIRCFKDPEAAIGTIKHVADEFPCGPDRVAALRMGIKLLCKWDQYNKRTAEPERSQMLAKTEAIHLHFERSYTDAMTEIALRRNGLETYLPLFAGVQGAEAAVRALTLLFEGEFARPSRVAARDAGEPLYEVLRRLGAVYDIGLSAFMRTLLQRYLETPAELAESTAELRLPSARYQASLRIPHSAEAMLRRRIVYILGTHDASEAVELLLTFAYSGRGGIPCLCRARALEILFAVATHDAIAQLQQPSDVRRYFQALLYLEDFEYVGIPQSTADFLDCNKAALARSIWVEHHQNPRAIQLICSMCLDFGVEDSELMLRMLPRLAEAGMFWYVAGVLETVASTRCYAGLEELPVLWNQALVERMLRVARSGLTSDWVDDGLAVLGACVRSRYLPATDVAAVVRALVRDAEASGPGGVALPLACVALDILPYSQAAEEAVAHCIGGLAPDSIGLLARQLLGFVDAAATTAGSQVFVDWRLSRSLTVMFDCVDEREIYEPVLLHPSQARTASAFVQNRIRHDRLRAAVRTCVASGKRQLATLLVAQYYGVRPAGVLAEDARRAGVGLDGAVDAGAADDSCTTGNMDTTTQPLDADTLDVSRQTRARAARITDSQKLEIYLHAHQ